MGRTREFEEAEAVEDAMGVFWQHGYEGTSLPMLLAATGLSKSSLYSAFGSKEALFERCLDSYADQVESALRGALDSAPSAMAFVRNALDGVAREAGSRGKRRGCLVMNTANEFGQRRPSLARLVTTHTARFEQVFDEALRRAETEGDWRPTRPRAAVARYLVCTLSGLKTMAKSGASPAAIRETVQVALTALG